MKNTITITQQDISTEEKSEAFAKLFGLSTFYKTMKEMSVQVHGDGELQKLFNKVEILNPQKSDEDEQLYKKLRLRMEKESARLTPLNKATHEIEVTNSVVENLFQKSDLAKEVLGPRYWQAVFPNGAKADFANLRKYNPKVKEADGSPNYKNAIGDLQEQIKNVTKVEKQRINEI